MWRRRRAKLRWRILRPDHLPHPARAGKQRQQGKLWRRKEIGRPRRRDVIKHKIPYRTLAEWPGLWTPVVADSRPSRQTSDKSPYVQLWVACPDRLTLTPGPSF